MARKPPEGPMDRYTYLINLDTVTREEIVDKLRRFSPYGSGALGEMRLICGLLCQICILKGFAPITPEDVVRFR
jgi:hypothetical protein